MTYTVYVYDLQFNTLENRSFDTMEEIEAYVDRLKLERVPFRSVAVFDLETREGVRVFKTVSDDT